MPLTSKEQSCQINYGFFRIRPSYEFLSWFRTAQNLCLRMNINYKLQDSSKMVSGINSYSLLFKSAG